VRLGSGGGSGLLGLGTHRRCAQIAAIPVTPSLSRCVREYVQVGAVPTLNLASRRGKVLRSDSRANYSTRQRTWSELEECTVLI
jgi:hypothetical protein